MAWHIMDREDEAGRTVERARDDEQLVVERKSIAQDEVPIGLSSAMTVGTSAPPIWTIKRTPKIIASAT